MQKHLTQPSSSARPHDYGFYGFQPNPYEYDSLSEDDDEDENEEYYDSDEYYMYESDDSDTLLYYL